MNGFFALIKRFVIRDLLRNSLRTVLTVAGIALGVAVMLAINLANGTALSRFQESIALVSGKANLELHSVVGAEMDQGALGQLHWLWEQDGKFTPIIDESAAAPFKDSSDLDLVQVLGVDIFADADFRSFDFGTKNSDDDDKDNNKKGTTVSIFNRNAAYVGSKFAARHSLKEGDYFQLLVNEREQKLQVAGIIGYSGSGRAFGGNLIVMDIGGAQQMFGMGDKISRIEIITPPDQLEAVRDRLNRESGGAYVVDRPQRRGQQVEKMIASFQYNLAALSLIALLAGMFVIYNSMSMSVLRKRAEIGVLRTLGVSRRLIFALFSAQALFMGTIGSLIGVLLGFAFSRGAVKAVSSTVQALYVDQPPADVIMDPLTLIVAFAVGVGISLIAALGPVLEAVTVSPAEATRRASYELRIMRGAGRLALTGILMLVFAYIAALAPAVQGFPLWGYVSAALTIFGVAFVLPVILRATMKSLKTILQASFGSPGKLAALSLNATPGRTAVTVASLMVGIAMMISLAIMIGSFRQTVIAWVNQTLKADLYVAPMVRAASNRGRISQEVVEQIKALPQIVDVDSFVEIPIEYRGNPTNLGAGDLDVMARHGNLMFLDGRKAEDVFLELRSGYACIVTESFALKNNLKVGEVIEIPVPGAATSADHPALLSLRIAGIYQDYASDLGYIVIPRSIFSQHFSDYFSTTLAVYAAPDADLESLRLAIFSAVGGDVKLNVRSNRELRTEVLRIFDNTFAITYALHAIAILVAILGVMNALFAITYEMRREFAILSYLGAARSQLRKMILLQAALLGFLGNVFGVAVGAVLSLLLIHVVNKQSFGWTVQLALPLDFIWQSSALVMLFALLSGIVPAQIATRKISAEALRYE